MLELVWTFTRLPGEQDYLERVASHLQVKVDITH